MVRLDASDKLHFQFVKDVDTDSLPQVTEFELDGPGVEAYVMGRSDVSSNYEPDIDMTPLDGQKYGISRRHAVLLRYEGVVHLMDLGSMNGTFVNRERLSPYMPFPLDNGVVIGLGNLQLAITQI